jgi:hypothetical protein
MNAILPQLLTTLMMSHVFIPNDLNLWCGQEDKEEYLSESVFAQLCAAAHCKECSQCEHT